MKKHNGWLNTCYWNIYDWCAARYGKLPEFARYLVLFLIGGIFIVALICFLVFISPKEYFPSPDGRIEFVVEPANHSKGLDPGFTVRSGSFGHYSMVRYHGNFIGLYWAPDSEQYIIISRGNTEEFIDLHSIDSFFSGYRLTDFTSELNAAEEAQGRPIPQPKAVTYDFIQWSEDSREVELSYFFTDEHGTPFTGSFWYDLELHRPESGLPPWAFPIGG